MIIMNNCFVPIKIIFHIRHIYIVFMIHNHYIYVVVMIHNHYIYVVVMIHNHYIYVVLILNNCLYPIIQHNSQYVAPLNYILLMKITDTSDIVLFSLVDRV